MLGFTTLTLGTQTFLRFADGMIDAAEVQALRRYEDTPIAHVWMKGNDEDPWDDDTQDYTFRLLTPGDGATVELQEYEQCSD